MFGIFRLEMSRDTKIFPGPDFREKILKLFQAQSNLWTTAGSYLKTTEIEKRITFEIKNGYYLELLIPETMKLIGSTEGKITKDKNGENVPHLEIVELVSLHGNLVNNDHQQDSRTLHTFVPRKLFGSLLEVSPRNYIFLKTFNSEFQEIKVWFTDQTSKPLEVEDKINLTLIIK